MNYRISLLCNIILVTFIFFITSVNAQNDRGSFKKFTTYFGVDVYQRQSQDPGSNLFVSELKFVNRNTYAVDIKFNFRFICPGREGIAKAKSFTLKAGSAMTGSWDGLFWYPCDEGKRQARKIGVENLIVRR